MLNALTEETSQLINRILTELLEQVEAEAVFLCDRGGNIVAQQSLSTYNQQENIAALAAGSFFATLEMARLVGETEFKSLLHQGEKMSLYMERAPGDTLMLVVFGKDSNPGLVKLYVGNARRELGQVNQLTTSADGFERTIPPLNLEMNENAQPFTRSENNG